MQSLQKKDSEGVVFCPKCHTKNLSSQKRCGKCGYIFPHKEKKRPKNPKPEWQPYTGETSVEDTGQNEQNMEENQEEEPQVPKILSEKDQTEGHLRSIGMKNVCKVCGAQNSVHVSRCVRCGHKFTSSKK